jgi:2-polyprenyl-3-methyl-5-hydroxy-6-metoxy-1,4-benzoquinol methylase
VTIVEDPQGREVVLLNDLVDFHGRRVLEIGCGDGRLTFSYAAKAGHVTAIDPEEDDIQIAREDTPPELREVVRFLATSIEDFRPGREEPAFDLALFGWSL